METDQSHIKNIIPNRLFVNKLPSSQIISSSLKDKNQNEKNQKPISISRKEDLSFLNKGINSILKSNSTKSLKFHSVEKVKNDIEQNKNINNNINNNNNDKINNNVNNNEINDNINNNVTPIKKMNPLRNNFITVQTSNSLSKNSPFSKSKCPTKNNIDSDNNSIKKNIENKINSNNNKVKKEIKTHYFLSKFNLSNLGIVEENVLEEKENTSTTTTTTTTPLRENKANLSLVQKILSEKEGRKFPLKAHKLFGKKRIIHPKKSPSLTITRNKSIVGNINNSRNISNNNNNCNNHNNYDSVTNYYYNGDIEENDKCEESVNIEDLIMIEEKFILISKCIYLRNYSLLYNICFEWWNYFFNSSLKGSLTQFFLDKNIKVIIEASNTLTLITILIIYDLSHKPQYFESCINLIANMLSFCNRNYLLICQSILSKIKPEYLKGNIWVDKLREITSQLSNYESYVTQIDNNTDEIYSNITQLILNIQSNYQILNYNIINIFNNYTEFTPDNIYRIFMSNILRINNKEGSVLFSTLKTSYPIGNYVIKSRPLKPLTLILDLDETLMSFVYSNENEGISRIRPYLYHFLDLVKQYYELILFTAATREYADPILDVIEENKGYYFNHRLYRESCTIIDNNYMKEIGRIGRDIKKTIIVDNMAQNFKMEKANGILISSFWGEDSSDRALLNLGRILVSIAIEMMEVGFKRDIREELVKYRDDILKQVTMN